MVAITISKVMLYELNGMMGMAELTQEEKQKIYEEEKARIASEDSPVSEIDKKQRRAKLLTYFSLSALILLIIYGFYIIIAAPNVLSPADNLKLANYRLNLAKGILNNLDDMLLCCPLWYQQLLSY